MKLILTNFKFLNDNLDTWYEYGLLYEGLIKMMKDLDVNFFYTFDSKKIIFKSIDNKSGLNHFFSSKDKNKIILGGKELSTNKLTKEQHDGIWDLLYNHFRQINIEFDIMLQEFEDDALALTNLTKEECPFKEKNYPYRKVG